MLAVLAVIGAAVSGAVVSSGALVAVAGGGGAAGGGGDGTSGVTNLAPILSVRVDFAQELQVISRVYSLSILPGRSRRQIQEET